MRPVTLRPGIGDNRPTATLYYGQDVRETLRTLPDASIHMVCTSPPYWGLRDYGVDGQLGLEPTPDEFVSALVDVFRTVRRVLRPDGTLWVNLGDSYVGGGRAGKNPEYQQRHTMFGKAVDGSHTGQFGVPMSVPERFKPKDLAGIPWRVALALQADGWYLRSDIIWHKPSCMPESVTDRPTRSHEYVFLFAHPDSGGRYFYDAEAVREPKVSPYSMDVLSKGDPFAPRPAGNNFSKENRHEGYATPRTRAERAALLNPLGRNKRSVWTVNPKPYRGAHFAVWPPELVEPMIRAGTSAHGVCRICGSPWKRVVERGEQPNAFGAGGGPKAALSEAERLAGGIGRMDGGRRAAEGSTFHNNPAKRPPLPATVGWEPTCDCVEPGPPVPATVLDPFSGSATTGLVALTEGRNYIGLDLNPNYLPLAEARVQANPAPVKVESDSSGDIFDLFGGAE